MGAFAARIESTVDAPLLSSQYANRDNSLTESSTHVVCLSGSLYLVKPRPFSAYLVTRIYSLLFSALDNAAPLRELSIPLLL